jgi:ADP-heptose:LPS heptosyltransferase
MFLFLSAKDIRDAVSFLDKRGVNENRVIVFIQIACGPNDMLRSWSSKNIALLSDMLIQNIGAVVILNSGPGEEMKANKILALMKNKPIINDANINLTAALIKLSNVFVGLDTGTTHIANALKTPLVALFGPTSIEDCGPIPTDRRIVIQKKLDCRPCFNSEKSSQIGNCIKQGESNCMKEIEVSEVYLTIQSLLTKFTKDKPINM